MWQRNAILLALGLSISPRAASLGEEISGTQRLPARTNWVTCDVAMGRLVVLAHRAKQDQPRIQRTWPDGTEETYRVTLDRGLVSLHYSSGNAMEELQVRVVRREQVEIEQVCRGSDQQTTLVRFVQEPDQPLRLTIQTGDSTPVEYAAPSLWHLLLAHPDPCRTYLSEPLRVLMPNRDLSTERNELRSRLLAEEIDATTRSRQEVRDLVACMADREFRVRQRAHRELRAMGHAALAFLDEVEHSTLDSEQQWRLRALRESIVADLTDSPDRVTAWLINDESTWLALLNDEDPSCRAQAAAHRIRLCEDHSVPPPGVGREVAVRLP